MSKQPSITDMIIGLQEENERLKSLEKWFDKACRDEFGYDIRTIHKMIGNSKKNDGKKVQQPVQQGQRNHSEQSEE